MVKINDINSTATFAWSNETLPTLATGTAAGVIDDDFSSSSVLSFYDLQDKQPKVTVEADAKFHDLDWSKNNALLAGALENGTIQFWNTEKLNSEKKVESVAKGTKHSGQIKSLQFNPIQHNILASGGANSEIFIWDTNKLTNLAPFAPGTAMTPMDTVQSVAWNNSVSHIFASAGSAGYTSIWDLKAKKEVLHLTYTENSGSRANLSVVAWHPTQSTKLITASESDGVPVLLTWDLRNSNAPETILSGHKKGILSVDWNDKDPNFLLSSGKDNTTILWNPITGQRLAQYPTTANWVFKTRFAPASPDVFASASFDKKVVVQTLQDTSPPVTNRINSATENDFWNKISDTDTQQPEYFVKQAPSWYGSHSAVSFGFGGKIVTVSKDGAKESSIKINKFKPSGSKDNDELKTALESGDFKSLIDSHLETSYDDVSKSDWELLNDLEDKSDLFDKFIALKVSDDSTNGETPKADASNGEDFFSNLGDKEQVKEYLPSGEFDLLDKDSKLKDLSDALLSKNLSKAVDISLSNDKLVEALVIALNGPEELKQKVKNAYFAKHAEKDPIARLLYSASSDNVSDLVENGSVSNWKEIATSIKVYSKSEENSKAQFAKLGDRIYAADPVKNRGDAIKTYITASALDKVAAIWVGELKGLESKILENSKKSAYEAHFESLTEFVEKFSAYRSSFKLDAPVTDNETLLSTILEYTSIISSSGQFELANKFLSLLSDKIPAVKLEKERIAKASGIRQTTQATRGAGRYGNLANNVPGATSGRNPYVAQPAVPSLSTGPAYGIPPAPTGIPPSASRSPYAPLAQPNIPAGVSSNPYKPAGAAASPAVPANPYKPAAPAAYNPYKPNEPLAPATPSAIPPPPKAPSRKDETEGWNDLPATFHRQPRRGTPAAAVNVASPSPIPSAASIAPPASLSRAQSFVNPPAMPPPPKAVSRKASAQVEEPTVTSPAPSNRYAPSRASSQAATPLATNGPFGAVSPPPAQLPPKNPYAPSVNSAASPAVNPYVPPPQANGTPYGAPSQSMGPPTPNAFAPPPQGFSAPVAPKPNPYAPSANATPPQQSFGAPPTNGFPMNAAAQIQQQLQSPYEQPQPLAPPPSGPLGAPPKSSPKPAAAVPVEAPKAKYPSGDRSHIPQGSLKIYESLNEQFSTIKPNVPEKFAKQVADTEKRLNILFDHLNNEDLLTPPTIEKLNSLVDSLEGKDYQTALSTHLDLLTNNSHEGGNWLVGIKRLIQFAEALN